MTPLVQQAQRSGQELVDHVFRMGILFFAIACAVVFVTTLLDRLVVGRLGGTGQIGHASIFTLLS